MPAHPELDAEQAYVDHAYACLERMRSQLERAGEAAIGELEAAAIEAWSSQRLATFDEAERGLCFGRLDLEGLDRPLYVGRRWVHEESVPIVVNWQAPAARPFYTANPVEPQGVALRRRFRVEGRRLLQIFDERLDGSAGGLGHGVADILLEELGRARDERMRDIVATIQSDQYRLITREPDGVLVIQGGPGTGKTAVGLHRASWLLYTHRAQLERSGVLVVGPNRVFMDYISHVLPMLGEDRVEQKAVTELVAGVEAQRREDDDTARTKGDARMAELVAAAVRRLASAPDELLAARVDGVELRLQPEQVAELITEVQRDSVSYADGREKLRTRLVRRFYEQYGTKLGSAAYRSFDELEAALRSGGHLNRWVERIWPRTDPERLVRLVLRSEGLAARRWSDADLALLDEARALLDGPPRPYGHLIVDEAQDLTPMQLRMLARRSAGAITILGDIAQASGPISYRNWEALLPHLGDATAAVEDLRLAYRVPREVMELALPLLPLIAPDVAAPVAYRDGGEPPRFVRTSSARLVSTAVTEAAREATLGGSTAVIAPETILRRLEPHLEGLGGEEPEDAIRTLTPRAAKGLEFDRVVLVEPAAVIDERGGVEGLRALYVALTRATKTLVIVHARPLPHQLGLDETSPIG